MWWSVSYISLKCMSYCSQPKNTKRFLSPKYHTFVFVSVESPSSLLCLVWTNAQDAASDPCWHSNWLQCFPYHDDGHTWCILIPLPSLCLSSSVILIHWPGLLCSPFYFTLFSHCHWLFPLSPFIRPRHCGAHFYPVQSVFLWKQLSWLLCHLLHYPPKFTMLHSEKSWGICIWKRHWIEEFSNYIRGAFEAAMIFTKTQSPGSLPTRVNSALLV